jgi:hypothetical protein
VRIGQDSQGNKQVVVSCAGPGLKWEAETEKMLTGKLPDPELSPKNIQLYLTYRYVEEVKAKLSCRVGEEELVMQVTQPME